jgi:hypothetical protein
MFGLILSNTAAQAQSQDLKPAAEAGRISDTLRSQSYPEVIYGQVMPDFDRGYMIQREFEVIHSPQQPMVAVYDANGKRVLEGRIWPQGAGSVRIFPTAMTRDGGILAGGWAVLENGTTPGYLAKTDAQGKTIQSVYTGDFKPREICEAPDGTVWSLGRAIRSVTDTEVVRHYSFEKGLLHSFLPEETVRSIQNSDHPWFSPFGSFLRCGKDKVSIYLEFTDEYAEISNSSFVLTRWKIDQGAAQQRKANGLAVTDDGRIYASFSVHGVHGVSGPYGLTSLYQVKAEPGNPIARLLPVGGTVDFYGTYREGDRLPQAALVWLWGADGNQLVVWRADEPYASWVSVEKSPTAD